MLLSFKNCRLHYQNGAFEDRGPSRPQCYSVLSHAAVIKKQKNTKEHTVWMSSPSGTFQAKGRWLQASASQGKAAETSGGSLEEGSSLQLLRKTSSEKKLHKSPLWENHMECINQSVMFNEYQPMRAWGLLGYYHTCFSQTFRSMMTVRGSQDVGCWSSLLSIAAFSPTSSKGDRSAWASR